MLGGPGRRCLYDLLPHGQVQHDGMKVAHHNVAVTQRYVADDCHVLTMDAFCVGPVFVFIAASETKPTQLPTTQDCSRYNDFYGLQISRAVGGRGAVGKAAGTNFTDVNTKRGFQPRGLLKTLLDARRTGNNRQAGGDGDYLWVGPVAYFSAPMDVNNRDKRMKVKEVGHRVLLACS